ncbi:MAG: hypothetical protein JWL87_372 [Candidatus Adlerbacteria bacterium]|nr:hypothetical protein [Candidatus Adlerbacteria bacterium]
MEFFLTILHTIGEFFMPNGGKGTVLPEEYRPETQPAPDKQDE